MQLSETQENQLLKIKSLCIDFFNNLLNDHDLKIIYPFNGHFGQSQKFGDNPQIYKRWGYAGHFGIDFLTPWGTPILAVDNGKVIRSDYNKYNGNFIEIQHEWGKSLYLHFQNRPIFKVNDEVKKGQIIGHAGNTGFVIPAPTRQNPKAGTHLHFSIKINGVKNPAYKDFIDPKNYFIK